MTGTKRTLCAGVLAAAVLAITSASETSAQPFGGFGRMMGPLGMYGSGVGRGPMMMGGGYYGHVPHRCGYRCREEQSYSRSEGPSRSARPAPKPAPVAAPATVAAPGANAT